MNCSDKKYVIEVIRWQLDGDSGVGIIVAMSDN